MPDAVWLDEAARLPTDPRAGLERGLRVLARRKWTLLLVGLPVVLLGMAYLLLTPERFVAQGTVLVGVRQSELLSAEQARDPPRGEPDIDGAMALLRSQPTLRRVVEELDLVARPEFAGATRQAAPLLIRLRHGVAALLGLRGGSDAALRPMDPVDAVVAELRRDIRIERVGRSALLTLSYASADPDLAAGIVNALGHAASEDESLLARLSLAERAGFQLLRVSVAAEAMPPRTPSLPSPALVLGASVVLALAAGMAVVLLREFRAQQTVMSVEEVGRRGMRSLGLVLEDSAIAGRCAGLGLVASDPTRPFCASVSSLQAALATLPPLAGAEGLILLVTSALPAEGKSLTTAALAASLAASGHRVLLLDADLRSPSLHRILHLEQGPGLAESLGDGTLLDRAIRRDPATGIHILPAGEARVHPLAVLGSAVLRDHLQAWRRQFDAILIDSPPVLAAGDARLLAPLADQVVVVARWGSTSWGALAQALQLLCDSGARLAGVAVSRVDVRALSAYDRAYAQVYGPGRTARIAAQQG